MITLICIATFISTLLGGLFALKFKSKLYLVLGFSAGAVLGVAFFNLFPSAIELSAKVYSARQISWITGLGFIIYLVIDRLVILLNNSRNKTNGPGSLRGTIGAFSLTLHSFLDGVAIGLAFQVSNAFGIIVATAVLVHDFADGINTANVILKENGSKRYVLKWLFADAAAPLIGAYSTFYFQLPKETLGILLALVAGFFIYIGASDFLPESHESNPKLLTLLMTLLGFITIFIAIQISGMN
ncbi:MAG TPA: ZIP family metal transporter [Mucilaginibacter sp.]